jgi:phosphohistidine phosphatase SixA
VDEGVLRTFPIIALRHAKALGREDWDGKDSARPLTARGKKQAKIIAGPLLAFGIQKIISSPATRCVKTVAPLATALGLKIDKTPLIGQDAWEEGKSDARTIVGERVRARRAAVLCSHGPVLPEIMTELALATGTLRGSYLGSASALEPAAFSVVHMSVDNPGSGIVAIETHEPKV